MDPRSKKLRNRVDISRTCRRYFLKPGKSLGEEKISLFFELALKRFKKPHQVIASNVAQKVHNDQHEAPSIWINLQTVLVHLGNDYALSSGIRICQIFSLTCGCRCICQSWIAPAQPTVMMEMGESNRVLEITI
jgi:hypothetical protein